MQVILTYNGLITDVLINIFKFFKFNTYYNNRHNTHK